MSAGPPARFTPRDTTNRSEPRVQPLTASVHLRAWFLATAETIRSCRQPSPSTRGRWAPQRWRTSSSSNSMALSRNRCEISLTPSTGPAALSTKAARLAPRRRSCDRPCGGARRPRAPSRNPSAPGMVVRALRITQRERESSGYCVRRVFNFDQRQASPAFLVEQHLASRSLLEHSRLACPRARGGRSARPVR
jgi:hypothetical protein